MVKQSSLPTSSATVSRTHDTTVRARGRSGGFTLTELMIAITVLGILSAFALPSLTGLVRGQRVKTATSDVYASLVYARSEAIKRAANIKVVPNSADWAAGWTVVYDYVDPGTGVITPTTLKVQDVISGVTVSGATATFTFQRDGRLTASIPQFVLRSVDSSGSVDNSITARCIRLDPSGKPNTKVDSDGNPANGCQ